MSTLRVLFPNPATDARAADTEIAQLQQKYGFSDAYAAQLKRQNGFQVFALESLAERSQYLVDAGPATPLFDFAQLYSTSEIPAAQDRIRAISPWFVSIGKGYGGDQYAEVRCGEHKGAVVHLNKEVFLGVSSFEAFAEQYDDFDDFDFDFDEHTAEDQADFLVTCEGLDLATIVAPSVAVFLAECVYCDTERFVGHCVPAAQATARDTIV